MDEVLAIERRRRNLRIVLFVIILATLPFYCAGFLLWATAPQRGAAQRPIGSPTPTFTPIGVVATATPLPGIITPLPLTWTPFSPLQPTPGQFIPPVVTRFLSPTPFLLPTLTLAPTLTPFPTFSLPTLEPPTATLPLLPTFTFTPPPPVVPTNTEVVPPTVLPFPTETPLPPVDPAAGTGT